MQTIQITNPDIEHFINSEYGDDTKSLLSDFVVFIKHRARFLKDKREFNKTFEDVKNGIEPLYDETEYEDRMSSFRANLANS
jgi:hypothetical protein